MKQPMNGYGALEERVHGLSDETRELRGDIRSIRNTMVTRDDLAVISGSITSLATKFDTQQQANRPNIIGWLGTAASAILISLTLGGAFGGLFKNSVDERFVTVMAAIRDLRIDEAADVKDLRATALTKEEYASRSRTEIERREAGFSALREINTRQDAEMARMREAMATKDDRAMIVQRQLDANARTHEDIQWLRDELEKLKQRAMRPANGPAPVP